MSWRGGTVLRMRASEMVPGNVEGQRRPVWGPGECEGPRGF